MNIKIAIDKTPEEIFDKYKDVLKTLILELSIISTEKSLYTYNTEIGKISIEC